jgi:hypothetical protein
MVIQLLDAQGIATGIAGIAGNAKALQETIHAVAVSCLAHVRDHGDTTLAVRLLSVLPSGQRRNALAAWFKTYSSGKLNLFADKHGVWSAKLLKDRTADDFKVDDAMDTNYGDMAPEAKVKDKPMTLEDLVKVIARFTKNDKTLKDGHTPMVGPDLVKAAQRALAAITA